MFKCGKVQFQAITSWPCFPSPGCALFLVGFLDRLPPYGCKMAEATPGLKSSQHLDEQILRNFLSQQENTPGLMIHASLSWVMCFLELSSMTKQMGQADWLWPVELNPKTWGQHYPKPYDNLGWGGSPKEFWAFIFVFQEVKLDARWEDSLYFTIMSNIYTRAFILDINS